MDNYLSHYGVLGMKWGQRRVRKLNEKAAQTRDKAKAKEYSAKAKKIETKHRDRGGKAYNYTKNQSTLQAVGKSLVLGTYGALKYNEARAKGEARGQAFVNSLGTSTLNGLTMGGASIVIPRVRQRKAEMARQNS